MSLTFEINNGWGVVADLLLLAVGFVLIIKGGDMFVDASTWVARALRVPEIIIGATIVSIGTTLPELITSVTSVVKGMASGDAALVEGYNAIAVGNAVGSMMCNAGLILALVMLIKPPATEGRSFAVKGIYLLCISAALGIFAVTGGGIALWEGIVLLSFFVLFIGLNLYEAAAGNKKVKQISVQETQDCEAVAKDGKTIAKNVLFFILGAAAIALGAMLLVDNAQNICVSVGIPQQIVGVTVVAIGTSLPELVTSLTSLKKGNQNIGLGNIIGANVINATLLLGLVSCITGKGLPIDWITKNVAVWVMLAISVLLIVPSVITKKTSRWQGAAMLALYLGFMVYNVIYIVI